MVRLVILDVEGVITAAGGSQYPWKLDELAAVREFLAAEPVAVVLCTGRQVPYAEAVIQALDLYYPLPAETAARVGERGGPALRAWPSIGENGCCFYDPITKQPHPNPRLTDEDLAAIRQARARLRPLAARTGAVLEAGKDLSLSLNPPPVSPGARERRQPAEFAGLALEALGDLAGRLEVKFSASAVDVTPRGVSKASAVRSLLEWTGLDPAQVAGVGDTKGDEAWLREIGWPAAPANGRENLPGLPFYAERESAAGLLEILQELKRRGYRGFA